VDLPVTTSTEKNLLSNMRLLEKSGLGGRIFGFAKVAQANADEAKALLRAHIHSFPQRQGDVGQFLARRGRRAGRVATREDVELACLSV
jgi:hypothetical protein